MAPLLQQRNKIAWPLVLAYLVDWIFIIVIAAIGGGLSYRTPASRLFSPLNPAISYPYAGHGISTGAMFVLCIVMPGLLIVAVVVLLLPLPTSVAQLKTRHFWVGKAWEINAGWLGLALANALAVVITQGVKLSFGKPRPDFLDRCRPDLTGLDLTGSLPSQLLLDRSACTQTDLAVLNDGFRSFFSGHSSSSFAGLVYFSLWLALKFNIILPQVHRRHRRAATASHASDVEAADPTAMTGASTGADTTGIRSRAAAPPTWGAIIFFAPILLATWIASTRWIEYKHDGWDVGFGILFGTICAIFGFRWYHSDPILAGQSWTWGPRTKDEAFWLRSNLEEGDGHGRGVASSNGVGRNGMRRKEVGNSFDGVEDGGFATRSNSHSASAPLTVGGEPNTHTHTAPHTSANPQAYPQA